MKFNAATMELPIEINKNSWLEWVEDRKERGKQLTKRAAKLSINLLIKYTKEIQAFIIETSIMAGWTGLFPPKVQYENTQRLKQNINDRIREQNERGVQAIRAMGSSPCGTNSPSLELDGGNVWPQVANAMGGNGRSEQPANTALFKLVRKDS